MKTLNYASMYIAIVLLSVCFIARGRISHFSERLVGSSISDSGFIAGRLVVQRLDGYSPFKAGLLHSIGWPGGIENRAIVNYTAPLSVASNYLLAGWTSPEQSQILFSIFGMIITGLCIGLVIQRTTSSHLLASIGVLMVTSSSAMLHWAQEVPSYTFIGLLIGLIFFSIKAVEEPSTLSILLAASFGIVSVLWAQYFALFAFISLAGVGITGLAMSKRRIYLTLAKITLLTSLGLAPYLIIWLFYRDDLPVRVFSESRTRGITINALFSYNSYFYVGSGICSICLLLLMFTFKKSLREKVKKDTVSWRLLQSSVATVLICLIFLGQQRAFGVSLPASLIPTLVPWFRHGVYASHLIQILLVLILLVLTNHFLKAKSSKIFFVSILLLTVGIDGFRQDFSGGDRLLTRVVREKAIVELAGRPIRPVANFPWELSSEFGGNSDSIPCLMSAIHKMPLVNTCDYDEPATPLILTVQQASTCDKLEILKEIGVGYLIVNFSSQQPLLAVCLLSEMADGKISLISESGDVKVWEFLSN